MYCYCLNNPISYCDPSGHFVIAIGLIITAALITACIGAGLAFGSAYISDVSKNIEEDGFEWSDLETFSDNWRHYIGVTLGGAIAGFGIGICGALGAATAGALGYMSRVYPLKIHLSELKKRLKELY